MLSEGYQISEGTFGMIEQARVRPELVTETELGEVVPGEPSDVIFQDSDCLRTVLLVIANDNDSLRQKK